MEHTALQVAVALLAICALPILMLLCLAIFERGDGRHRFRVVNGRLRRTAQIEKQTTAEIERLRRERRAAYNEWLREGWKEVIGG